MPLKLSTVPFVLLCCLCLAACSSSKQVNYKSVTDPAYQRRPFKKLLVLARIDQPDYRKRVEDAFVNTLKEIDQQAISAHDHLSETYAQDSTAFFKQLDSLGVDGIFTLSYLGEQTMVRDEWHYNGGYYSMMSGGYGPFDLDTRSAKVGYVQLHFYPIAARRSQWRTTVPVSRSNGLSASLLQLGAETKKRLRLDKIL